MSTEHQQYSTQNQRDAIRDYALRRNFEILRTYADDGKSGLRIDGRMALQRLIEDVLSGIADFQVVLVYDISRWGRFQDTDESAYYEYVCRHAGINVIYCAEQFENDGSVSATIIKNVKRAMAGECSRELSSKVFAGQRRLIELGFRQGGTVGFGFTQDRDYRYIEVNRYLRQMHPQVIAETQERIAELGTAVACDQATGILTVDNEFTISLVLARCYVPAMGQSRWKVRFDASLFPDIIVAVRLDYDNRAALDYFLLPRLGFCAGKLHLGERNAIELDSYRRDTLDGLYELTQRVPFRRVA